MAGRLGRRVTLVTLIAVTILVGSLLWGSTARADPVGVNVPAMSGPPGTDTGVSVHGSASISASGTIDIGYATGHMDTPDGDASAGSCSSQCPEPTFTLWSLIAKIGDRPWQEVGSGPTTVLGTGELYLAVDDDSYGDNSGSWSASVTADPSPADNPRLGIALDVQNGQVTSGQTNAVEATFGPSPATGPMLTLTNVDDHNGVEPRGGAVTYTLTAGVSADSPVAESSPRLFTIYDPLPAGETVSAIPSGDGWNCDESGGGEVRCTTTSPATIAAGATLPAISVPVNVAASASSPLPNSAEVISSDAQAAVIATDVLRAPSLPSGGGSGSAKSSAPVNVTKPHLSGTALPGDALTCEPGTWANSPTGYHYTWTSGAATIAGATTDVYNVSIADETDTLACEVTAVNSAGASSPASSPGVLVAMKGTLGCPRPSGKLSGTTVGRFKLGETRERARKTKVPYNRTHNGFDNFCLYGGWGIRVAYSSTHLLTVLSPSQRRTLKGRLVLALSANPYYGLKGVRPGATLTAAAHHLKVGKPFHVGKNYWYFAAGRPATAVLKVTGGVVQEVGLANRALTPTRALQRRFIRSFPNG